VAFSLSRLPPLPLPFFQRDFRVRKEGGRDGGEGSGPQSLPEAGRQA